MTSDETSREDLLLDSEQSSSDADRLPRSAPWEDVLHSQFERVFNAAPVLMAVAGLDGYYKRVNPAFERILGHTEQESLSKPFFEFIHPDDREAAGVELAKLASGESVVNFEDRNVCKDGSYRWIRWTVIPVPEEGLVFGFGVDITRRKLVEHALLEEKQRFQSVYENAPVGIALVGPDGHVIKANQDACRLLGYAPHELTGLHFREISHPEDLDASLHLFDSLIRGEMDSYNVDKRYVRKDGSTVWAHVHVSCVKDESGRLRDTIVVCEDITDRKRSEQRLQQDNIDLERRVQQRTAELSTANEQLRSEIEERKHAEARILAEQQELRRMLESHERDRQLIAYEIHDGLAQQLVAAKMHMEAFKRKNDRAPQQAAEELDEGLQLLSKAAREVRHLIGGLRPPLLDEAGLAAAIRQIASDMEEGGLRVDVETDLRSDRFPRLTENTVFRIVQESLTNARLHSGSERVAIRLVETEETLQIEVRDWGCGFDPATVPNTCYGLGGIRQRARLFGGTAAIESAAGQGTRIAVELPRTLATTETGDARWSI